MLILRRSLAALFAVLLLQLTLLGSGTLCALQRAAASGIVAGHEMPGMTGPGARGTEHQVNTTEAIADAGSRPVDSDCGGFGQHDGCGLPWAPGQCSSMTACDITGTPSASGPASDAVRLVAIAVPTSAIAHAGPTFAPEIPPPRV